MSYVAHGKNKQTKQKCKEQAGDLRLKHLLPSNISKHISPSASKEFRTPGICHTSCRVVHHLGLWKTLQVTCISGSSIKKSRHKSVQPNKNKGIHLHDLLLDQILLVHLVLLWGLFCPKFIKRSQAIRVQVEILSVVEEGQIREHRSV